MNDKEFDNLIKTSLKKNMNKVKFDEEMKNQVLENRTKNKLIYRIKELLNYEIELPLAYVSIASFLIIVFLGYNASGYFPDPEEISSFQLEWILINLTR